MRLDAEIKGWREEREHYVPDAKLLEILAGANMKYDVFMAMGTWCGDSREQIPRLQAIMAKLGDRSPIQHYDVPTWFRVMHVNVTAAFAPWAAQ